MGKAHEFAHILVEFTGIENGMVAGVPSPVCFRVHTVTRKVCSRAPPFPECGTRDWPLVTGPGQVSRRLCPPPRRVGTDAELLPRLGVAAALLPEIGCHLSLQLRRITALTSRPACHFGWPRPSRPGGEGDSLPSPLAFSLSPLSRSTLLSTPGILPGILGCQPISRKKREHFPCAATIHSRRVIPWIRSITM